MMLVVLRGMLRGSKWCCVYNVKYSVMHGKIRGGVWYGYLFEADVAI